MNFSVVLAKNFKGSLKEFIEIFDYLFIFQSSCDSFLIVHLFLHFSLFRMASGEAAYSYLVLLYIQELSFEPQMNRQCDLLNEMTVWISRLQPNRDDSQQISQY